jgi:hypothetical protein
VLRNLKIKKKKVSLAQPYKSKGGKKKPVLCRSRYTKVYRNERKLLSLIPTISPDYTRHFKRILKHLRGVFLPYVKRVLFEPFDIRLIKLCKNHVTALLNVLKLIEAYPSSFSFSRKKDHHGGPQHKL